MMVYKNMIFKRDIIPLMYHDHLVHVTTSVYSKALNLIS